MITKCELAFECVFFISRCFETGIYCGFFRKNWEILFSDLIQTHGISEAVVIDIYNEWDTTAMEKHRLSVNQGSTLKEKSNVEEKIRIKRIRILTHSHSTFFKNNPLINF